MTIKIGDRSFENVYSYEWHVRRLEQAFCLEQTFQERSQMLELPKEAVY